MTQKKALVTGGSRGLGLEVARRLAELGYGVTIVGRRADSLESAIRSFPGDGHCAWAFDLAQPGPTRDLLRRLEEESFHLVINNAGAARFGAFSDLSPEAVEELIHLNFTTPALISRQFLQNSPPAATLVNVTSIVGSLAVPGNSLYCATKAGLKMLSECLWFEARARGVRVLDFRPVSLKTDFHRLAGRASLASSGMGVDPAAAARDLVRAIETGREFVYPHGLFARVLDLLSRWLPRKLLISRLGKKSSRAGYLTPPSSPVDQTRLE
jgi:hypothetical protein